MSRTRSQQTKGKPAAQPSEDESTETPQVPDDAAVADGQVDETTQTADTADVAAESVDDGSDDGPKPDPLRHGRHHPVTEAAKADEAGPRELSDRPGEPRLCKAPRCPNKPEKRGVCGFHWATRRSLADPA